MRDPTVDLEGRETVWPTASQRQHLELNYAALLEPFRRHETTIRSIVVVSPSSDATPDVALLKVTSLGIEPSAYAPRTRQQPLESLSEPVQQLCRGSIGDTLFVVDDETLEALLASQHSFRALALLPSKDGARRRDRWRYQRALFDLGLIAIASINLECGEVRCFLASDALSTTPTSEIASRGEITMTSLGRNGGFGNQLFQYAYVKLYAMRHGLTAKFPDWQGRDLFRLADPLCGGAALRQLSFNGFTDDDLRLWEAGDPPVNIDLWGYFQETPECWRHHRQLLRQMFSLPADWQSAFDVWRSNLTRGGERSLVALHVRRGDYRTHTLPYFQFVPEQLYLDWLRKIWPTLSDPLLFIATDEPDLVLRHFAEFSPISEFGSLDKLPAHVRDFEVLRRADCLAVCNSSYSRMAAILAGDAQKCFLPSHETGRFEPYQPWIDAGFWARFAKRLPPKREAVATQGKSSGRSPAARPTIYVDVSDLLLYLLDHTSLSGIQRVQCEVLRHVADAGDGEVDFVVLEDGEGLVLIEAPALMEIIDLFRLGALLPTEIRSKIFSMLNRARRCLLQAGDTFITLGAFWGVRGAGRLLQQLKNSGVVIGLFIHDIIPITHPEYFQARDTRVFVKAVVEALTFADFVLTSSEYNKGTIAAHCRSRGLNPQIDVVPLAHQFTQVNSAPEISERVKEISESEFILCVGTIEVRKNPLYLFNLWKLMARSERELPTLVYAGRRGWLVRDFIEQLENCGYLDGKIIILNNVTDGELDLLYRKCLLTVFPSFAEGWGLPVGESLAYGKICICAAAGGTSEVGKALADYVDPYNVRSGLEQLLHYLNNPEARSRREQRIAQSFEPRSWGEVAGDLLASAKSMVIRISRCEKVAAITLPPNKFLPITADVREVSLTGEDGSLSAELACVVGWRPPDVLGVWAEKPEATLQFRTKSTPGANVHLILRLACLEGASHRLRIKSASGSEVTVSLGGERDTLATLSCEVDENGLVTVTLAHVGQEKRRRTRGPFWCLKGFMYLEPGELRKTQRRAEGLHNAAPGLALHDGGERIRLLSAPATSGIRQLASKEEFIDASDAFWSTPPVIRQRRPPILADAEDEGIFLTRYRNSQPPPLGAVSESLALLRRSNQYLSTSRFSEGVIFDHLGGVRRGFGFLDGAPLSHTPWLLRDREGIATERGPLARVPHYDRSLLIFYNGNLHNYYHWLAEGLLLLDVLVNSFPPNKDICIALPKSMDINPLVDHRESLKSLGFDQIDVIEVGEDLVNVAEVIWVECDLVEQMPAQCLQSFQRRIASKYATQVKKRSRRLLIERKGPTRMISNFEAVQALLSEEGFDTISLEGMAPSDQILLFQSAEFVVGTHGAGLANLLFCEPGTKVIEFMPSVEMRPFFWIISDSLDLRHAVQFCPMVDGDTFQATLAVDLNKLTALYKTLDGDRPQ